MTRQYVKLTPQIKAEVCRQISEGKSLHRICMAEGMPTRFGVFRALIADEEFRKEYELAREMQADKLADECIEISDDDSGDILDIGEGGDKRMITNSANVQRSKLKVDARRWKAAQMSPRKWGQQQVQHTGDGGGPMQVIVNVITKALPAPQQPLLEEPDESES